MIEYEDNCVGCPPEMGCLGRFCSQVNVPVHYCDTCGKLATYSVDGEDYCDYCLDKFLNEEFSTLTEREKAEKLEIKLTEL